jgi:cytochrome c peroxidase
MIPASTGAGVPATRREARMPRPALAGLIALSVLLPAHALAHGLTPPSLKGVEAPMVGTSRTDLRRIVRSERHAVALGKALFWDIQVGSDGVACATCHHHAGADGRRKGQVAPGGRASTVPSATTFETTASGADGGPNYTVLRGDFPLFQFDDPADISSPVAFATDDVLGSAGSFSGAFVDSPADEAFDECQRSADAIFHVGGVGTRKVTARNTPSVINAVFGKRLFWDGRANDRFNGSSSLGDRDPEAGVWTWERRTVGFERLALDGASLASQAVEPPLDTTEMSCSGRTFADVGRKLASRQALAFQDVHPQDSVLARYRDRSGKGLRWTYDRLIRRSFRPRYWAAKERYTEGAFGEPAGGGAPYSQIEANFALFFGLAVQLYESTLVSDDAPFDSPRDEQNVPTALDDQEYRGLLAYINFHCLDCHGGPLMGSAASRITPPTTEVNRRPIRNAAGQLVLGLTDTGFINTGVAPADEDPGLGVTDPFGQPLSFAVQYRDVMRGERLFTWDPMTVRSCRMTSPFNVPTFGQPAFAPEELIEDPAGTEGCLSMFLSWVPNEAVAAAETAMPAHGRLPDGTVAAFRVPSLRNVELTGPYMHNGSMATLEEVLEFYNRGGNVTTPGKDAEFLFSAGMDEATMADLIAFLKTLTDERVRWEKAPFDHPSLPLPVGHTGDHTSVQAATQAGFAGLAETEFLELPAVGADGRDAGLGPLLPFDQSIDP